MHYKKTTSSSIHRLLLLLVSVVLNTSITLHPKEVIETDHERGWLMTVLIGSVHFSSL